MNSHLEASAKTFSFFSGPYMFEQAKKLLLIHILFQSKFFKDFSIHTYDKNSLNFNDEKFNIRLNF